MKFGMSHYDHKSIPDAKFESDSSSSFGDMTSQKISLGRRERVMKFGYLPPENGFSFKKNEFLYPESFFRPKIDPPCQFQQFSSIGKIFHFQNFWDVSMRKEQQQPP